MDVVLVSDAKNVELKRITEVAVASAGDSVNIIVVESNPLVFYKNAFTVHPKIPFNYNQFLNIGASYGVSDFIFFGNNDLLFLREWSKNLVREMEKYNVVSASPMSPYFSKEISIGSESLYGYEIIKRFCGWAFVWRRDFFNKVGGLKEDFRFWCSDNIVIEQLRAYNEKHILVPSSLVQHVGGLTTKHLISSVKQSYTIDEVEKFNKMFNTNLWLAPHLQHYKQKNGTST